MAFSKSRTLVRDFIVLDEVGSTNAELAARAVAADLPDFTVLATLNQTAGRGRLDRVWVAPPGQALAVSVLLRPGQALAVKRYSWIPLIAGLAMARAVRAVLHGSVNAGDASGDVSLKWPNDVLIAGRKVSGLLAEFLPGGAGVVVGAGLNLTIPEGALPVPTATSLLIAGATGDDLADIALSAYLKELRTVWTALCATDADAGQRLHADGIRAEVARECSTLGKRVRVSLPGGSELFGTAEDLDDSGQLRIRTATDASLQTVAVGDISHLRYE